MICQSWLNKRLSKRKLVLVPKQEKKVKMLSQIMFLIKTILKMLRRKENRNVNRETKNDWSR